MIHTAASSHKERDHSPPPCSSRWRSSDKPLAGAAEAVEAAVWSRDGGRQCLQLYQKFSNRFRNFRKISFSSCGQLNNSSSRIMGSMAGSVNLQQRDIEILEGLREHGPHSISAIAEFYFSGKIDAARKRIQKLVKAGLIANYNGPGQRKRYSANPISNRCTNKIQTIHSDHDFEVREVLACLLSSLRQVDSVKIEEFSLGSQLSHWYQRIDPDAALTLSFPGDRKEIFFVEHDRGTETLNTILGKCLRYQNYKNSGDSNPFRVLIVCKSTKRAGNICKLLRTQTSIKTLITCASFQEATTEPLGKIWMPVSSIEPFKNELFPNPYQFQNASTC